MGTHPIFESDFDCLTEWRRSLSASVRSLSPSVHLATLSSFAFALIAKNLQEDLDWKIIYVGSANSNEHDQELDEMSTGPIPVGTHEFVLEASGPNPALIPAQEVVGVTVVLITCSYREQEFVRIGYYINNEYVTEEMKENPPDMPQIDQLKRLVCLNPRVTRMVINWDEKDENSMPSEAQTEETSEPTPFNFELSNS